MISYCKIVAMFKFLITFIGGMFHCILTCSCRSCTLLELGPDHVPRLLFLHGILTTKQYNNLYFTSRGSAKWQPHNSASSTVGSFPRHTPQPTIEDESEAARVRFSTICAAPCEAGTVRESTLGLAQGLQARAVAGRLLDMLDRELGLTFISSLFRLVLSKLMSTE